MSAIRTKRLQHELKEMSVNPPEGCTAGLVEESNLNHWIATIQGPSDTPYEGGIWQLEINFPVNYPFSAPLVKFKTPIYHCNVSNSGSICLDILKKQWSPAFSIQKVLLSITALLDDPNPKDPLNGEVARLMESNQEQYKQKVREYVLRYATSD